MKAAIYIEVKGKDQKTRRLNGEVYPWAGYIYAAQEINPADYSFDKNSNDQYGNAVKVYRAKETTYFEHPGGLTKTDKVVLFDEQPTRQNVS